MSQKGENTQKSPSQAHAVGAKINVFPPRDRCEKFVRETAQVGVKGSNTARPACTQVINVFRDTIRAPESPYMDPATGKLIPIEERDWRRGAALQEGAAAGTFGAGPPCTGTDGRDSLDPNELDFSIERKESRLPPEE